MRLTRGKARFDPKEAFVANNGTPQIDVNGHSRSRQWKSLLLEKHHAFGQAAA
jgi:hypothetical protein